MEFIVVHICYVFYIGGKILTRRKAFNIPKILLPFQIQLKKSVLNYVEIICTTDMPGIAASKFAGYPYLPKTSQYPKDLNGRAMQLLAQINFSEFPFPAPFPQQGLLQFFVSENAYNFSDTVNRQDYFFVHYYESTNEDATTDFPHMNESFPIEKNYALEYVLRSEPVSATDYRLSNFIPNASSYMFEDGQTFEDVYLSTFLGANHKIGGYPYFIEDDFRKNSPFLQRYDTLLLQIISNDEEGIMWGNSGVVSFFINREKLKQLDFTDIYFYSEQY